MKHSVTKLQHDYDALAEELAFAKLSYIATEKDMLNMDLKDVHNASTKIIDDRQGEKRLEIDNDLKNVKRTRKPMKPPTS